MPHLIVEYTSNLKKDAEISALLKKGIEALVGEGYPLYGMRARGVEIGEYLLADGKRDCVMVHGIIKVAPGHTPEHKQQTCQVVFDVMRAHFADAFSGRCFMLSVEIVELESGGGKPTLKYSNVKEAMAGGTDV